MGKSEEEHLQQINELRAALGGGDGTESSRQAMREVFSRQEEARLAEFRAKQGMPEPPQDRSPRRKMLRLLLRWKR